MQKIRISYNPYKMKTVVLVNGTNVCETDDYLQFREFIETDTPLQTWAEPIPYKNWKGIINELATEECYDEIEILFDGRKIDYEDLMRACESANSKREIKLSITYKLEQEYSDAKLAQNIDVVMQTLLSEKFSDLVDECGEDSQIAKDYKNLPTEYQQAKNKEFKIVFAGLYSSGKSTILNALIHRNILPTSDETCTSKTCRLKHDKRLKGKITLECFDEQGEVVVQKETFDSDEACLARFWEITPLGAKKSNPETIDTIEICLDLSHLYPTKEMEKEFNLVIVDTPGCNSSKTKGAETDIKQDIKIALDAINNGEKEMVVICADSQDYEDESLGVFLKAINETAQDEDDRGDFNDRFLFVLNKCDVLKYSEQESVVAKKENFARYLMDTKRWGIEEKEDSPKFIPKIFMVCAYIKFAVQMGVANFTDEEVDDDENKQNLQDAYESFYKKVVRRKNKNYFLASVCDIPEHRKVEFIQDFEAKIDDDNEDAATAIQSGMDCIESAIRDYIARYAYPFKVRDLMDTFDALLKAVNGMTEYEDERLQKRIDDMGKGISEREEVERAKEEQEKIKEKLVLLKKEVEKQKQRILEIFFDKNKFSQIRQDLDVEIENEPDVIKVRKQDNKYSKKEVDELAESIDRIFGTAFDKAISKFEALTLGYKNSLDDICTALKAIAEELESGDTYTFEGYSFSKSLGVEKINRIDVNTLRKRVENTKDTVYEDRAVYKRNPIKDETYKWWQFIKKHKQAKAAETIFDHMEKVSKDVYTAEPLQSYIDDTLADFRSLCTETADNYSSDIEAMKEQALKMANDIPKDVEATTNRISQFVDKINACGNNLDKLQEQMDEIREKRDYLKDLLDSIKIGGGQYV
ncbi:MAG: dynamin family protein [Agathobacter sp.]|nr:dynamin family protein [Agathobacter sp.]